MVLYIFVIRVWYRYSKTNILRLIVINNRNKFNVPERDSNVTDSFLDWRDILELCSQSCCFFLALSSACSQTLKCMFLFAFTHSRQSVLIVKFSLFFLKEYSCRQYSSWLLPLYAWWCPRPNCVQDLNKHTNGTLNYGHTWNWLGNFQIESSM